MILKCVMRAPVVLILLMVSACGASHRFEQPTSAQSQYVLGLYARQEDRFDEALRYFDRALKQAPNEEALIQGAFSLAFLVGDNERLVDYATLQQATPNAQLSNLSSMVMLLDAFHNKRWQEMPQYYDRFKGSGFEELMLPTIKAWSWAVRGNRDEALKAINGLVDYDPSLTPIYEEQMAYLLDYLGDDEAALQRYGGLIRDKRIRSMQPILSMGDLLVRQGKKSDAENLFTAYQTVMPNNLHMKHAMAELAKKRPKFGAPARNPSRAIAATFLMAANELAGNPDYRAAATIYSRFATIADPSLDEAYVLLGNLYLMDERYGPAKVVFSLPKGEGVFAHEARIRYALTISQEGQSTAAIGQLQEALAREPNDEKVLQALGNLYQDMQQFDQSVVYYSAVLDDKPKLGNGDWFLLFSRGIAYEQTNQWAKAEADFLKALSIRPNDPQLLNYLGYSWIDRGMNYEKAREMLEKAVELRPEDGFIVDSLGWAEYLLGNYETALKHLQKAVQLEPGDATLNEHLGDVLWQLGRQREARFQWQHAIDLGGDDIDPEALRQKVLLGLQKNS